MTPGEEQRLGVMVGRVEGRLDGVEKHLAEMREEGVAFRGELRQSIGGLEGRVDSLEGTRDRGTGRSDLLKGAIGAGLTLLGIAVTRGIV